MFKRIWSLFSAPPANSEHDISNDNRIQNSPQSKRQKREHFASEQASPFIVVHVDRFQQRDSRHSYPRRRNSKARNHHQRQRRNRYRNRHQYRSNHQHYSYTDCEAEWEDDDSSTDGKPYQRGRETTRRRKYKKRSSSRSDDGSSREERKAVGNWKRQNAAFYHRRKSERERRKRIDNYSAVESKSEPESNFKSPPNANQTHTTVQRAPTKIIPRSPAEASIGRTVQINDPLRLKLNCDRMGKVIGWKDKDTVLVECGKRQYPIAMKLKYIDFLPKEEKVPKTKPKAKAKAKPGTKTMKTRSDLKKENIENLPVATRTRSRLKSHPEPKEPTKEHHQKTKPQTKRIACSKMTRKPAAEPKRKPEQRQKQMPISTPSVDRNLAKDPRSILLTLQTMLQLKNCEANH